MRLNLFRSKITKLKFIIFGSIALGALLFLGSILLNFSKVYTEGKIEINHNKLISDLVLEILPQELQPIENSIKNALAISKFQAITFKQNSRKLKILKLNISNLLLEQIPKSPREIILVQYSSNQGYNGKIKLLMSFLLQKSNPIYVLSGVRILQHKETPGLGDVIDSNKNSWIINLTNNSSNTSNNKLKRQFNQQYDTVTGATVSTRAVIQAIKEAQQLLNQYLLKKLNTKAAEINTILIE